MYGPGVKGRLCRLRHVSSLRMATIVFARYRKLAEISLGTINFRFPFNAGAGNSLYD